MTLSTSPVAVCCSRASSNSRVSRAISVSPSGGRCRRLGAERLLRGTVLRGRASAGLPPAPKRPFIDFPTMKRMGSLAQAWRHGRAEKGDEVAPSHLPKNSRQNSLAIFEAV